MFNLKKILLYLWCFPQNLLGLLFLIFIKDWEKCIFNGITFYYTKNINGGISLGEYIILSSKYEKSIKHEYGHCIQSKILGWMYLPIVGLSSLIHAWLCKCKDHSYYEFWCEKWADKLGGVKR